MGSSELGLSISLTNEDDVTSSSFKTYKEVFINEFPHALALGMSYEQYWFDDVSLLKDYLKAQEIKNQMKNNEFYLQAAYQYDVLCRVASLYNAMKPTKPQPFLDAPYPLTQKDIDRKRHEESMKTMDNIKLKLLNMSKKGNLTNKK